MIKAFGGRSAARSMFDQAMSEEDFRWALELGTYLVLVVEEDSEEDKLRLGSALRAVAYCSSSSNIRNWCLTRALELDGKIDLSRFRKHRFREQEILSGESARWVPILRVLLDPQRIGEQLGSIGFYFDDGSSAGLIIRSQVAVGIAPEDCEIKLNLTQTSWAKLLAAKVSLSDVLQDVNDLTEKEREKVISLLSSFDLVSLQR